MVDEMEVYKKLQLLLGWMVVLVRELMRRMLRELLAHLLLMARRVTLLVLQQLFQRIVRRKAHAAHSGTLESVAGHSVRSTKRRGTTVHAVGRRRDGTERSRADASCKMRHRRNHRGHPLERPERGVHHGSGYVDHAALTIVLNRVARRPVRSR